MNWNVLKEAAQRSGIRKLIDIDVGARWGVADRWTGLGGLIEVYGFDPDATECARLNAKAPPNVHYIAAALGDSPRTATLHLTSEPACSSLYPAVPGLYELVPALTVITPAGGQAVTLVPFDDWCERNSVGPVAAMKIDTQGSELGVLQGAQSALASVQLLEIEVEFNPIYEGQPLFADVDAFLRARGFVLWQIRNLVHYSPAALQGSNMQTQEVSWFDSTPISSTRRAGQLFWAHAYYVPAALSAGAPGGVSMSQGIAAAIVACGYGLHDLACFALKRASAPPLLLQAVQP